MRAQAVAADTNINTNNVITYNKRYRFLNKQNMLIPEE